MANEKECGSVHGVYSRLQSLIARFLSKNWRFLEKAWKLGASEPRKVIHCLKVGVALSLVSLFYYMRPLYDGVGGTAMWAVMTVVVVFEYTVGWYPHEILSFLFFFFFLFLYVQKVRCMEQIQRGSDTGTTQDESDL